MAEPAKKALGGWVETVLHTSVATFYNNLVTRPTGRAVRLAIENQLEESRGTCLSVLDFSRVGVLDFSCADEVIAQLLRRYRGSDRPYEAYFVVQGVSEHHRDPIEAVLRRHNLLLVSLRSVPELWGPAPERLRRAWSWLEQRGSTCAEDFASARNLPTATATSWLNKLASWRIAIPDERSGFSSLLTALRERRSYPAISGIPRTDRAVAEAQGAYATALGEADGNSGLGEARGPQPQPQPQSRELGRVSALLDQESSRDRSLG